MRASYLPIALSAVLGSCAVLTSACSSEPVPPEPEPEVTYYRDVYPILQRNCVGCHVPGGLGGFDLSTGESAQSVASLIAEATADRRMPPYLPGPLTPPLRGERRLTEAEIVTLEKWASLGAPIGSPSDRGPAISPGDPWPFGEPDLSFDVPKEPYLPDPALTDDYRCFAIPLNLDAARANIGYRVTPGNPEVVHHVIAFLFDGSALPALEALDAETERPGWPCFNQEQLAPESLGVSPSGLLGYWVPGTGAVVLPEGTMRPVPAGAVAVLNMHYNTAAWDGETPDQTRFEVALADPQDGAALQPIRGLGVGINNLSIPFGEAEVVHERTGTANEWTGGQFASVFPDGEAWAVGTRAHAHLLMTRHRITLNKGTPDEKIVLDIPRWDFHWQSSWQFVEPFAVRPSDTVTITCVYDNTAEHRLAVGLDPQDTATVTWGEGSSDEMCGGGIELTGEPPGKVLEVCNALDNSAPEIEVVRSLEPLPVGVGGTIVDGLYHLESLTLHTTSGVPGPTGYFERITVAIQNGTWQIVGSETGTQELRETKAMATSGADFTWTMSCPEATVLKGSYDATPTTIALYYETPEFNVERRLVRAGDL